MTKKDLVEILLAVVILCSVAYIYSPEQAEVEVVEVVVVPDSVYRSIVLEDFTVNEEIRIRKALAPLFAPRCTGAFVAAGLRSPLEVAMHEGVVIMPSSNLYYYSARSLGLVDKRIQLAYRKEFSTCRAQAGTVCHVRRGVVLTTDGRARIFLFDSAFMGESFFERRLSLNGVLAHEFIHVGGQPPTPGWFFETDLGGFEHYDEIMEACTCDGE